jgi:hypothetical protein
MGDIVGRKVDSNQIVVLVRSGLGKIYQRVHGRSLCSYLLRPLEIRLERLAAEKMRGPSSKCRAMEDADDWQEGSAIYSVLSRVFQLFSLYC